MSESNVVSHTMEALGALYPSWHKASQDQTVRYAWGRAMSHAGLGMEQIKAGIIKAEQDTSSFPPSCGQFIEWCKGSETLPKHRAWQMAAMSGSKEITDPVVLEAARRTGTYDIQNGDQRHIKPLFFEHYEQVCREQSEGHQFALPAPEPSANIEDEPDTRTPEQIESDRKKAKAHIQSILDNIGGGR